MSLKLDSHPSSAAFESISAALSSSPSQAQTLIKKGGAIFCFVVKSDAGATESWYIDLKDTGSVGRGEAPPGKKPGVTLALSDADFGKLVAGNANAQKLFMSGKLKIKGDVMKATKMEPVLKLAASGGAGGGKESAKL